jgi:DNA-binding transcriptional ArsR family regulator
MDQLSATFAALADPTRRAILSRLALGEASVNELAAPFDVSVRAVSKHVAVLEKVGLITRSRSAQRRMSQLEPTALQHAEDWLTAFRKLWDDRFDQIDVVLEQIKRGRLDDPRD